MSYEWSCHRFPKKCKQKKYLSITQVVEHPLKAFTFSENKSLRKLGKSSNNTISKSSSMVMNSLDGADPLSQFSKQQDLVLDPLSKISAEYESSKINNSNNQNNNYDGIIESNENNTMESWSTRRSTILNKYTTSEKLTIKSSYLSGGAGGGGGGGGDLIKTQMTMPQKVKYRLEQLDDFEEGSVHQMMDLTQHEYSLRIEQLNQELVQAWHSGQRVKSLKIAIQCSKLLMDTSVMQFYPSQFVLITDILDIFGNLVYERLRTKSDYLEPGSKESSALPNNFTPDMVPELAKETCQNWFYKIASIRELLPRLYVEIAIIKCYSFLTQTEFNQALLRLTNVIRGIGDPLVSAYARCYLCRIGMTVTKDSAFIKQNLNDFLVIYPTMFNGGIRSEFAKQHLDFSSYLSLYKPALDLMLQAFSTVNGMYSEFDEIIDKCKEKKNSGLLIHSILTSFTSSFIANRSNVFVNILSTNPTDGVPKGVLLRSLIMALNECSPSSDQLPAIFNSISNIIGTISSPSEYMLCIVPWSQFCTQFDLQEIHTLLGDIILRMNKNRAFENYYHELESVADKLLTHTKDFEGLIILDNFLTFIDLFQKESTRFDVCKNIMTNYKLRIDEHTNDPVIHNSLMYICKILNDNINALTVDDERRQISDLISNFIRKVDYGMDLEKQLLFYVEARGIFLNLDAVLVTLVHYVNRLAITAHTSQHTRKIAVYVRACAAYCIITIPSIVSVITRMDLYLLTGKVALLNACLGQADVCFETAINLICELPTQIEIDGRQKSTEIYLVSFICNLLSTLVIVPDSPERGVLYLTRTLLTAIKQYKFDVNSISLCSIYLNILDILTITSYENYPYHMPNTISNDKLYGSDPKFIAEINLMCSEVVERILMQLKQFGDAHQNNIQCKLALELFEKIITKADITNEKISTLAINLWNLSIKQKDNIDAKLPGKILMQVERIKEDSVDQNQKYALAELITKMKIKT